MKAKLGPNNQNTPNTIYLEGCGREYGNYKMVNDVRRRFLEGVPSAMVWPLSFAYDSDCYQGNGEQTKSIHFCVVQQSADTVPVFMLPATDTMTSEMSEKDRNAYMQKVFDQCYLTYTQDCQDKGLQAIDKQYCAATVVAGTKTMWGGNHFTAMVKPPGQEQWLSVDPTSFGGPQWFNRKQCGGYSSMIEAEAIMHYSSKTIDSVKMDETQGVVARAFWQFIECLSFKFNTWFAGARNEVILNSENLTVGRGSFETTYAEMADFSASRLARAFDNQDFIKSRIQGNGVAKTENDTSLIKVSIYEDIDPNSFTVI